MKNSILVFTAMVVISCYVMAQSGKQVPDCVKKAFVEKFSKATNVKWDKEKRNEWEAEFKLDGKNYSANYTLTGEWLETEYAIEKNEIPSEIKAAIEKNYAGYKIKESEVSETPKAKVYELELTKGIKKMEITFDSNAKVVKK